MQTGATTPRKTTVAPGNLPKTPSSTGLRRTVSGGLTSGNSRQPGGGGGATSSTTTPTSSAFGTPVRNSSTPVAEGVSAATAIGGAPAGGQAGIQAAPGATGGQNITVAVRVRAFHAEEAQDQLAIRMKDTTCEINVPHRGRFPFSFDKCFWSNRTEDPDKEYSNQEDVFNSIGKPLVDNALAGFNSSIIAYGQTGSGKTYSIFGPHNSLGTEDEGLIPRVCNNIFQRLSKTEPGVQRKVFVSVLEVYLENVYDLLHKRKELKVRGDSKSGFNVAGLKQIEVTEYNEVLKLIAQADAQKTFAATAIHDRSSRAHTLFQLEVRTITNKTTRTATVVLADLAGCERVKTAHTDTGIGFEQAKNINLSLLNLGTCIEAVVTRCRNHQTAHNIGEFRNSTLTKLLKDFIGGNSRTAMLVTIAPGLNDQNFSIQSLRFADRAKQIQCHAVINSSINTDATKMKEEISQIYNKRRELLDKECDLELQQTMVRKKQADLEKMSFDLLEERKLLHIAAERESAAEAALRQKREAEIEAKLKHLQRELNDAQSQRENLDERYLDMCEEQASLQQDKEQITQDHARLMEELETLKHEHLLAMAELEVASEKNLEAALVQERIDAKAALDDLRDCLQAKMKAVTIECETKLRDQSSRHVDILSAQEDETKQIRSKLISREEELALKCRSLDEKEAQCEVLVKAHQKGRGRVESLESDIEYATEQQNAIEVSLKEARDQLLEMEEVNAASICDKASLERDMKSQIEALKTKAAEVKAHHDEVIASLLEMNATASADAETVQRVLTTQIEVLKGEAATSAQTISGLQMEKQDLSKELVTTVSMLGKVEQESAADKEKENANNADLAKQVAQLQRELESKTVALTSATAKITEVSAQNSTLSGQLQAEEFAHSKARMKLNAAVATTDEAEAQLKHNTQVLTEELAAEQHKVSTYRKRFYDSKNDRDMIHQQCVAAHNALGLALQSTFQYGEDLAVGGGGLPLGSSPVAVSLASPAALASPPAASQSQASPPQIYNHREAASVVTLEKENQHKGGNKPVEELQRIVDSTSSIATTPPSACRQLHMNPSMSPVSGTPPTAPAAAATSSSALRPSAQQH